MNRETIITYIKIGREFEFEYKGNKYSITYYNDNRTKYISVCKFNEEPIDVSTPEEALRLTIDGVTIESILTSLPENKIMIY